MKQYILLFFIFISLTGYSQTIGSLFQSMPADILPGVSEDNKTMLLVDTGKTTVPYTFGEISKIRQSSDYLEIRSSDIGITQLKLLPVGQDSVIVCVIKTVCGDVCDSNISFYTTDWRKLEKSTFLPSISAENFFDSSKKETENYKYAVSLPDIYPISAAFGDTGNDMTLTFNYKRHLSDDLIAEIKPFLRGDSIILKWDNHSFK